MKRKILSIEDIMAMQDEFFLPEEEGFYQYILEDDMQRILTEDDYGNDLNTDYEDDIDEYERDKEDRRHYGRYDDWLTKNGLINSNDAYYRLSNLFCKIDYYYTGGPCGPEGYDNSYEYDQYVDYLYNPPSPNNIKEREINEEYNLRKFESLKSISPNASDEEIEKFLYKYEYNSKAFHLPTEIERVRDYLQEEEHINDFRFTKLSEILKDVKPILNTDEWMTF